MNYYVNKIFVALFVLFFLIFININAQKHLTIIVNCGSFTSVEEAANGEKQVNWWDNDFSDDRTCTESFAAVELAHFLPLVTTIKKEDIKFIPTNNIPLKGDVILIGSSKSNPLIASYQFTDSIKLKTDQSFRIRAFEDKGRIITIIEGKDRIGSLYGVYTYLEQFGLHFYGLGEKGIVYPAKKNPFPKSLLITENPAFLTRGFHAWEDRGNTEFFLWMVRNKMNYWTTAEKEVHFLKKLGMVLSDGFHVIQKYFLNSKTEYPYNHPIFKGDEEKPDDPYAVGVEYKGDTNNDGVLTYFEAHPEWFGLREGKRSDKTYTVFGDNYCTSNVDATKELSKNLIQSLIDERFRYVDILNFWMMDNDNWCECEQCKKIGSYTDRLFNLLTVVQTEIKKAVQEGRLKRNIQLSSLAYLGTVYPPTHHLPDEFDYDNFSMTFFPIQRCYNHSLADPSCTEYNQRLANSYLAWTTGQNRYYQGSMFVGEYYNISYLRTMPVLYTRMMAVDIPWYYKTGTRHFHYMHTPTRYWGTWTLNQYLLARLLWNPNIDVDDFLNKYFRNYYPTTFKSTRLFYDNLEKGMESFKMMRYWGWKKKFLTKSDELFPTKHFKFEPYFPKTNDGTDLLEMKEHLQIARKYFDESMKNCTNKTEKLRLLEDERRFAYGETMFAFHYHLYRVSKYFKTDKNDMARNEFKLLKQSVEKLKGFKEILHYSSEDASSENGFLATQAEEVYEFYRKKYEE